MFKISAARLLDKECDTYCKRINGCSPLCPAYVATGPAMRICKRDEIRAMAHPTQTFFKMREERRAQKKAKLAREKCFGKSKGEATT